MGVQLYSHVGLTVSDLARSRRFFAEGLGFSVVTVDGKPRGRKVDGEVGRQVGSLLEVGDAVLETLYITRDGQTLELVQFVQPPPELRDPRPANAFGLTHICFLVDDLPAQVDLLVSLGGHVLEQTETTVAFGAGDGIHVVFVHDPDRGLKVELIQQRKDLPVAGGA